jgi:hypothetical protein
MLVPYDGAILPNSGKVLMKFASKFYGESVKWLLGKPVGIDIMQIERQS